MSDQNKEKPLVHVYVSHGRKKTEGLEANGEWISLGQSRVEEDGERK